MRLSTDKRVRIFGVVLVLAASVALMAATKKQTEFDKYINARGYNIVDPAESWPYPGGFVVADNHGATFVDLPPALKPTPETGEFDIPNAGTQNTFSLAALLSGLTDIIGGNPGVSVARNKTIEFTEIDADAQRITYSVATSLIANPQVSQQLDEWITTQKKKVYVVMMVGTTKSFKIDTTGDVTVDLTFNGPTPTPCPSGNSGATSATGSTGTTSATSASGTPGATGSTGTTSATSASSTSGATGSTGSTGATGSTSNSSDTTGGTVPGGDLHFCTTGSDQLNMNSKNPLVFASLLASVTKDKNTGQLMVNPVTEVVAHGGYQAMSAGALHTGTLQSQEPPAKHRKEVPGDIAHSPWPTR